MNRRMIRSKLSIVALFAASVALLGMDLQCPPGDDGAGLNPPPVDLNTAPRINITEIRTPGPTPNTAEQGDLVEIDFTGSDEEDRAFVRVFASTSANPTTAEEISILSNFPVGPGSGSGTAFWPTNTVPLGSYNVFAEINDGTFDATAGTGNRPVRVAAISPVLINPPGVEVENVPPTLSVQLPASDAGLTNNDVLTIRYTVSDPDSITDTLTVRFLFDRDRNAGNDATQPPIELDNVVIPSGTIPAGQLAQFNQEVTIDLNNLPIRVETDEQGRPLPYFVRVELSDGENPVINMYAVGAVRLLRAPTDVVDMILIGGRIFGAVFQGFQGNPLNATTGSRAGSSFAPIGDLDGDGLGDFAVVAETASPFGNPRVGEVYVIYGRERRIDPDLAQLFPFGTGRYAGIISLNTVGSFVPFPAIDPRFQTIFNVRGHIISQPTTFGGISFGVTDVAGITDITFDGLPEVLVGHPLASNIFDAEDDDPCDSCNYDEMERAPMQCFDITPITAAFNVDVEFNGTNFPANAWRPQDPASVTEAFPPNVDFELDANRLVRLGNFNLQIEGMRVDELNEAFVLRIQIENDEGPFIDVNVPAGNFTDMGSFTIEANFPIPTLPVMAGESMPPSIYDGRFVVFVRPTVALDDLMVTISVTDGDIAVPGEPVPIKTAYLDGYPNPIPNNTELMSGITPFSQEELGVVCTPLNRTRNPTTTFGFGNRDGHTCFELGQFSTSCTNIPDIDDQGFTSGESGYLFVNASQDIVLPLFTGTDANNDGIPDDGPAGTWTGAGIRSVIQQRAGQPPAGGHRGARFRGAYQHPADIWDPLSLFGYTIEPTPDIDASGDGDDPFLPQTDLLVSAPSGGIPSFRPPIDLTAGLGVEYSNDPGDPAVVTEAIASYDFGVEFSNVTSVTIRITGEAENAPILRVGLDNGGGFVGPTIVESLLWTGARAPLMMDGAPQLWPGDILGDTIQFSQVLTIPTTGQQFFRGGAGNLRIEIREDCAAEFSSFRLDFVDITIDGLLKDGGYAILYQGDDYTDSDRIEAGHCPPIAPTNGDPESGFGRPNSWPSFHCPTPSKDVRIPCNIATVTYFFGEDFEDSFGFARHAGDVNLDGIADIACGAPGNDNDPNSLNTLQCEPEPNALNNNGKSYIIFGRVNLGTGRPCDIPERYEIRGTHDNDQFGRVQGNAGDIDGDGNPDYFVGAELYDALGVDQNGNGQTTDDDIGPDAGFVGLLFGRQINIQGARSITPEQIGRPNFSGVNNPGCKFIGGVPGARLGGGTPGNTNFFASEHGQHGVASAGDFNRDGNDDLLITAPGQEWPAVKIEFVGAVADGNQIVLSTGTPATPKVTTFEFDFNNAVSNASVIPVRPASTSALAAQEALANVMLGMSSELLGVSAITSRTDFPAPLPDTPTVTFLRRLYTPEAVWVQKTGANIVVTHILRQGVAYLVFGDPILLTNRTFFLPQDLNRRNTQGNRVLKGMIFVSAFEKNSGVNDTTPDEAPIEAVSLVGDIDGDGFVDIMLGAPQADLVDILQPAQRRQSAGEAYLIYGNQFGLNDPTLP